MEYANITQVPAEAREDVLRLFKAQLDMDTNDNARILNKILAKFFPIMGSKSKRMLKCDVGELDGMYVLIFDAYTESMQFLLGHTYGLPRGCVVLYAPGEYIRIHGFFPKFCNDGLRVGASNQDLLMSGATAVEFNLKWSGFLVQLFAFRWKGVLYFGALTKNCVKCDTMHARLGRELVTDVMTLELAGHLADQRLYVGAEGMHPEDNTHGYVAKRKALVVTCVSRSFAGASDDFEFRPERLNIQYLANDEMAFFCNTWGLLVGPSYQIVGNVQNIVGELFADRDNMDWDSFKRSWDGVREAYKQHFCCVIEGTADHSEIVGGSKLEGFIMEVSYDDGIMQMVKVKLPKYTFATMLVRPAVQSSLSTFVSTGYMRDVAKWADRWCVSRAGKELFKLYAQNIAVHCEDHLIRGPDFQATITDAVYGMSDAELELGREAFGALMGEALEPLTVFVCVGPVGAGKSTFFDRLALMFGGMHFDCDDFIGQQTLNLKGERNDATCAALALQLLYHTRIFVSCGGRNFRTEPLQITLSKYFPKRDVTVVACVLADSRTTGTAVRVQEIEPGDWPKAVELAYTEYNEAYVDLCSAQRLAAGVSVMTPKFIRERTASNKDFVASYFLSAAKHLVVTLPFMNVHNADLGKHVVDAFESLMPEVSPPDFFCAKQLRLFVVREKDGEGVDAKHVTLAYHEDGPRNYTGAQIHHYTCCVGEYVNARTVEMRGKLRGKSCTIVVGLVPNLRKVADNPHITIKSGPLEPKQMKGVAAALYMHIDHGASPELTLPCIVDRKTGETEDVHFTLTKKCIDMFPVEDWFCALVGGLP